MLLIFLLLFFTPQNPPPPTADQTRPAIHAIAIAGIHTVRIRRRPRTGSLSAGLTRRDLSLTVHLETRYDVTHPAITIITIIMIIIISLLHVFVQ